MGVCLNLPNPWRASNSSCVKCNSFNSGFDSGKVIELSSSDESVCKWLFCCWIRNSGVFSGSYVLLDEDDIDVTDDADDNDDVDDIVDEGDLLRVALCVCVCWIILSNLLNLLVQPGTTQRNGFSPVCLL